MKKKILKLIQIFLALFARMVLWLKRPIIIGITGSVGKTSTKEAIFALLKGKFGDEVWKSWGNLNTEIGLPLAVLGLKQKRELRPWQLIYLFPWAKWRTLSFLFGRHYPLYLVLEYAADKKGDLDYLVKIARPDYVIVTNVGPAHLKEFKNLAGVYAEKVKLVKALLPSGVAVLNQSDRLVAKMAKEVKAKVVFYSAHGLDLPYQTAVALAPFFEIAPNKVKNYLTKTIKLPGRMLELKGIKGSKIIDDTYNANPLSMRMALEYLTRHKTQDTKHKTRLIVVLGDMLELGDYTPKAHLEIANLAKQTADLLVTLGPHFGKTGIGKHFTTQKELFDFLLAEIKKGDIILVKGSHSMHMEKIIEKLKAQNSNIK
ncbi:hypothetical protein HYU72_02400 [Candidatus Berkelbacteria bacterium]|nr:hypothetical protein [Candidatus Berkelbacteria bacterium]